MKLSTLFLIIFAIQISFIVFDARDISNTALFGFIKNPTDWSNTVFITVIGLIAAGAVMAGSFVGSFIFGKTDIMIFAPFISVMITWMIPLASLWQLISEESGVFGDANWVVASILTAPFLVYAFWSTLNWWRATGEG